MSILPSYHTGCTARRDPRANVDGHFHQSHQTIWPVIQRALSRLWVEQLQHKRPSFCQSLYFFDIIVEYSKMEMCMPITWVCECEHSMKAIWLFYNVLWPEILCLCKTTVHSESKQLVLIQNSYFWLDIKWWFSTVPEFLIITIRKKGSMGYYMEPF